MGAGLWKSSSAGERMDVYDENRRPTGRTQLRGETVRPGDCLTVVHVCLFDGAGRMLIQQRQSCKRSFPDLWDLSVGGAVQAGETSREAARRETLEELGLELDLSGVRPSLTVGFDDGFDDLYLLRRDVKTENLRLQAEEVRAVRWADWEQVSALAESGAFVPYYPGFLRLLFEMQDRSGFLRPKT